MDWELAPLFCALLSVIRHVQFAGSSVKIQNGVSFKLSNTGTTCKHNGFERKFERDNNIEL